MAFTFKTFDSDIDELYSMMDVAWAKDYAREPRLDYTPDFLRWLFDAPTTDKELLVGAYDGDKIIGFGSSYHRSMYLRGEPIRTTLSSFFTAHAEYRRRLFRHRQTQLGDLAQCRVSRLPSLTR